MARTTPSTNEQVLFDAVMRYKYDPVGFTYFIYPWGQKDTIFERFDGPRQWQIDEMSRLTDHILKDVELQRMGDPGEVYYSAIASGRGIGKSAGLGMINYWAASCWPGMTGIVTANTETQLRTRTMGELGKWHMAAQNKHWFEKSNMALRPQQWYRDMLAKQLKMDTQLYYIEGQPWSEENPDAFAGAHSQLGMVISYDEASGIPDPIWTVTEGFFTDLAPLRLWLTISNGRRNTGAFYNCFYPNVKGERKFWLTRNIDSRTVKGTDTKVYDRLVEIHGEESDTVRVEVRGMFPRTGSDQFIGVPLVNDAMAREVEPDEQEPLIMGVDVARYGEDSSVIRYRQGRDARSIPKKKFKGLNTTELARQIVKESNRRRPDAIMIDGGGVGGGVVDACQDMGLRVTEVQFGSSADDKEAYGNKRTEMYVLLREWLKIGALDDDWDLLQDLTNMTYKIHDVSNKLFLETKQAMKDRGLNSTDEGDALAVTFATPVARRAEPGHANSHRQNDAVAEYDEFA